MQDNFAPQFPRSVSGGKYRLPLTHSTTEAIGLRADKAYREFSLTDAERAQLLKAYKGVEVVDKSIPYYFENMPVEATKPWPIEPYRGGGLVRSIHEHNAGYLERVRAFIGALERRYYQPMPVALLRSDDRLRTH